MGITQITYIAAWWAVMRMDEVMAERLAVSAASRVELALYDPTHPDDADDPRLQARVMPDRALPAAFRRALIRT